MVNAVYKDACWPGSNESSMEKAQCGGAAQQLDGADPASRVGSLRDTRPRLAGRLISRPLGGSRRLPL